MTVVRRTYRITGLVQGVGFRPTLWHTARSLGAAGEVFNDADGVEAVLEADTAVLELFPEALRRDVAKDAPLARIDDIRLVKEEPAQGLTEFIITQSRGGKANTMVTPDAATCRACAEEMFTPGNRRRRYAFTNCTHCGPRYTITRHIPYDRKQTSMASFAMCPACQAEYDNPADRRFHAQPNACPVCGPQLELKLIDGTAVAGDAVEAAAELLKAGKIVAIKGLGGFHLAVDAANGEAVERLRTRKHRDEKPFAVMCANVESAERWVTLTGLERKTLTDPARPIVLAKKKEAAHALKGVADDLPELGVMIAYTPLHLVLFHALAGSPLSPEWLDRPNSDLLVMTSANPGGEPLVTDNDEAFRRLGNIADAVLYHNRDIVCRCDDSVVRVLNDSPRLVRRARGYTPLAVKTPVDMTGVCALGAALKTTAAVGRGNEVFVTEHIGDTANVSTCRALKDSFSHLCDILETKPKVIACDFNPDFYSSRLAEEIAQETEIPFVSVQHHHAHTAAVAYEYGVTGDVWGLALDGVGLGTDGTVWGAELLECFDDGTFERRGHMSALALPGGDVAAHEPWRMATAACVAAGMPEAAQTLFPHKPVKAVETLIAKPRLTMQATSAGRLFDAVSAIAGLCEVQHDEARAAMLLEAAAGSITPADAVQDLIVIEGGVMNVNPLLAHLIGMRLNGAGAQTISRVFHATFAAQIAALAENLVPAGQTVCLCGGTFLNRYLSFDVTRRLNALGYKALLASQLPPGDGAISFGQAAVAYQRLASGALD